MDYYKLLGVSRNASTEDIKAAFRKLALQFHPDRLSQASKSDQQAAARRFRDISEAYQVLRDDKKRAIYNNSGREGVQDRYGSSSSTNATGGYRYGAGPNHGRYHGRGFDGSHTGWHRTKYDGSRHWHTRRSFRINLSPVDLAFHAVLAGIIIIGLTLGDIAGKVIWDEHNEGKLFKDVMEERQRWEVERTQTNKPLGTSRDKKVSDKE